MLVLICGIPNAGKTTYSKRYCNVVHLDGIPHKTKYEQFIKCNSLAKKADISVVEGVYVTAKRRKELLEVCKDKHHKICVWVDTPLSVCLEREHNFRNRPEDLVLRYAKTFEPPTLDEGWDEIIIVRNNESISYKRET